MLTIAETLAITTVSFVVIFSNAILIYREELFRVGNERVF